VLLELWEESTLEDAEVCERKAADDKVTPGPYRVMVSDRWLFDISAALFAHQH
jgi:hypothetical protein